MLSECSFVSKYQLKIAISAKQESIFNILNLSQFKRLLFENSSIGTVSLPFKPKIKSAKMFQHQPYFNAVLKATLRK
jgi:hypothetical protein